MDKQDPNLIFQLATGYWASAALLAANAIGLFDALSNGAKNLQQVAEVLGSNPRATEMLLNACAGLGLLVKQGNSYALSPVADAFLVPGRPGYLGSALHWAHDQYMAWGELEHSVRSGQPVIDPKKHLGDDPQQTRHFVYAMHERAQGVARGVVPFFRLEGCRILLDVGGGPGTYAVLLAQQYTALRVTVLDLPEVVAIAQELIAQAGLSGRVRVRAGDATQADYGKEQYDAVLFSGVLHQMSTPTIQRMLAGAYRALVGGGRVFVSDVMLEETKTQPAFAALFSLQMLLTTHEGGVFSAEECTNWLKEVGFAEIELQRLPPPLPYTVVTAHKLEDQRDPSVF
jgi:cyclopropane fatty-acyl-phospholipid synthase-like methyltransferase